MVSWANARIGGAHINPIPMFPVAVVVLVSMGHVWDLGSPGHNITADTTVGDDPSVTTNYGRSDALKGLEGIEFIETNRAEGSESRESWIWKIA